MIGKRVAFFGPQYGVGGAGRVCASVGKVLARDGYNVDFLVDGTYSVDSYLEEGLPKNSRVLRLTERPCSGPENEPHHYIELLSSLAKYLRGEDGGVLVSNLTKFNLMAVWASILSGFEWGLVLVEHNLISPYITGRSRILPWLVMVHYPFAQEVVAVSSDVRKDLQESHGVSYSRCATIRNPVNVEEVISKSIQETDHDWFVDDIPVILGVGRFVEQKQFSVLLKAFEKLTRHVEARLMMIGDGPLREDLSALVVELGIEDRVEFLGFVSNPYKYMRKAQLLALSSRYEGFGIVVVEALACGTPVVATDCPGGPSDILEDGEYGELVDVGDAHGLADAMARTLENPPDSERLVERARHYRVDKVADRYAEVIERVAQ